MNRNTTISPCGKYRYQLWREWGGNKINQPYVAFIGLNPSTADEKLDDPTLRRCKNFAESWGYHALCLVNLFAYRSTDPKKLEQLKDPTGPMNDQYLIDAIANADLVVAAWGNNGKLLNRDVDVKKLFNKDIHCLDITKKNQPKHPLYIKKDKALIIFSESKI